jgi:hypothetical protein
MHWPAYIAPLSPTSAGKTLAAVQKDEGTSNEPASLQRKLLTHLDRKIFPHLRNTLDHSLFALSVDTPENVFTPNERQTVESSVAAYNLPLNAKYLVLAAYLCQVNRLDSDRQLFSIQKNGRKRATDGDNGEEVAFGTGSPHQPKTLRPRVFPFERFLSLYLTLVGLNSEDEKHNKRADQDEMMLYETICYLRAIGLLYEHPARSSSECIRLSQVNYWCSLTKAEAQAIADSVNLSLDRYTL